MTRAFLLLATLLAFAGFSQAASAQQRADYQSMATFHAKANGVPEALVHRVIMRESKYNAALVGRGGTIGLMQIKLATARGVGYTGSAEGLRDPNTNLQYGIKYLAGAYRAANGDHNRAVSYFAGGYYYVAKRQRRDISAPPHKPIFAKNFAKDAARVKQPDAVQASAQEASAEAPKP